MSVEALTFIHSSQDVPVSTEPAQKPSGRIFKIEGLEETQIAYNPTKKIWVPHPRIENLFVRLMPTRVESRDSHVSGVTGVYDPHVKFVEVKEDFTGKVVDSEYWGLTRTEALLKGLEDPALTISNDGSIVLSGVRAARRADDSLDISTEFFAGTNLQSLELIATLKGKDNRLRQLPDNRFLVAIRPQGGEYGRGKIGFAIVKNLQELRPSKLQDAHILLDQFQEGHWGGVNEIIITYVNGHVEAVSVGHVANIKDDGTRPYHAMAFAILNADSLDREPPIPTPIEVFARAADFPNPQIPAKSWELEEVFFTAELEIIDGDRAVISGGLKDVCIAEKEIINPLRRDNYLRLHQQALSSK